MDSKIKAVNDEPAANWIKTFENVITERNLDEIRKLIEKDAIIVEHRIYYGAQSPITKVFDDYDEFYKYYENNINEGDRLVFWLYSEVLTEDKIKLYGKVADKNGFVPEVGYY